PAPALGLATRSIPPSFHKQGLTPVRLLALILSLALAYAFLRGWPPTVAPLLRHCAAVLVLVPGLAIWTRRPRPQLPLAASRRVPRPLDYLIAGSFALALESALLGFVAIVPEPAERAARALHDQLDPEGASDRAKAAEAAVSRSGGNWLWDGEPTRTLPQRADFRPGNAPELFLRLERPEDAPGLVASRPYVSVFSLGRSRGDSRSPLSGDPTRITAGPDGTVRFKNRPGAAVRHRIVHSHPRRGPTPMAALQGAVAVDLPELTRLGEDIHLLPPPPADRGGHDYTVTSTPIRIDD